MGNNTKQEVWTEYQIRQWERAQEERWEAEAERERLRYLAKHPDGCKCPEHPNFPNGL